MARKSREEARTRRHSRVRGMVRGTAEKPRLCVFRSNRHVYAQLIDDDRGTTLCGVSTLSPGLADKMAGKKGVERAKIVGETVGELAVARSVSRVVFDRGGYTYGGQVKALADAARSKGLKF